MDNRAIFKISYGLYLLSVRDGKKDNGCIINTAVQVTPTPDRLSLTVSKLNYTHEVLQKTKKFNLSVLDQSADFGLFKNFGFQSGRSTEKFGNVPYLRSENGIAYLPDHTNAFISGSVTAEVDLGSHTLFIADVTDGEVLSEKEPMTYSDYHKYVKPNPKKEETTMDNEQKTSGESKGFICTVCGYVYEGDTLPDDFILSLIHILFVIPAVHPRPKFTCGNHNNGHWQNNQQCKLPVINKQDYGNNDQR